MDSSNGKLDIPKELRKKPDFAQLLRELDKRIDAFLLCIKWPERDGVT